MTDLYWCARCLAPLMELREPEYCPKCDREITAEEDYLTEVQYGARVWEDHRAECDAIKDGLIKASPSGGAGGG